MTDTTLTTAQQQRAEALERVARAARGATLLGAATTLPTEVWGHVAALAEWVVDGPLPEDTPADEPAPDTSPTTYRCPGCGNDHDLDAALDVLVANAQRDIAGVVANLRHIGLTGAADDLDALARSDRFRAAMRDGFLAFNDTAAQRITDVVDSIIAEARQADDDH